jgi:competence protein ComEC
MQSRSWLLLVIIAVFGLIVAACEFDDDAGDGGPDVQTVEAPDDDEDDVEPTPEPEPMATPEPEPTATPEPQATPERETESDERAEVLAEMTMYHFAVGQADATLIDAPDVTILIDAGDWQRDDVVSHVQSVGVDSLDLLILTHPHADHIGQVPQVMHNFNVGEVWTSGWEHDTATFERAIDAIADSDAGYFEPRAGHTERYGDVLVEVVHPVDPLSDIHDSLAVKVTYGGFSALYTGDAEVEHEREMMSRDHDLSATLLQLGHHGSSTSTATEFLDAVNPEIAIYSAGADNTYGHPHAEIVERVQGAGIELYGTDTNGTIAVTTDGESYHVEVDFEGDIVLQPAASPEPTPEPEQEQEQDEPATEPAPDGCIDINTADFDQLQQITHIGPDRAQAIIDMRPFDSVNSLTRLDGIAAGRLSDIKEEGLACVR